MMWDLPVENVMGTAVFLLTEFRVEPSNNHSGSAVGRSINCSLFHIANASSIKQCDDPKSNNATNDQVFLVTAVEVRERRKELGAMEVEFSHMTGTALPLFRQLFKSAMLKKLPLSFPSLTLMVQAFVGLPPIPQCAEGQSCAECPSFPHVAQRLPLSSDSFIIFELCFRGPVWHSCGVQRWSLGGGGLACCCIAWRGEVGSGAE